MPILIYIYNKPILVDKIGKPIHLSGPICALYHLFSQAAKLGNLVWPFFMYVYYSSIFLFLDTPLRDLCALQLVCEVCFLNLGCRYCSVSRDVSHCGGPGRSGKGWSRWRDASFVVWVKCLCVCASAGPCSHKHTSICSRSHTLLTLHSET